MLCYIYQWAENQILKLVDNRSIARENVCAANKQIVRQPNKKNSKTKP